MQPWRNQQLLKDPLVEWLKLLFFVLDDTIDRKENRWRDAAFVTEIEAEARYFRIVAITTFKSSLFLDCSLEGTKSLEADSVVTSVDGSYI